MGIGLIERKRVGLNKPNLIYVKNFASVNRTRGEPKSGSQMSGSLTYQISGSLRARYLESLSARVPEVCQSDASNNLIEIRMKRVILILFI